MLEQHQSVLVKGDVKKDRVIFVHATDEGEEFHRDVEGLTLSRVDWEDFGTPEQVTITVVAGDTLNVEEHVDETKYRKPMLVLVEIVPSSDGQHYVRGMAKNGEPLWMSETYRDIETARDHAYSYGIQVKENQDG